MINMPTNNYVYKFTLRTRLIFIVYFLMIDRIATVAVLSNRANGRFGELDENFAKYLRKSSIETRDGPRWSSSAYVYEDQDRGSFQEPPVMDKPGIFFPDDINPWTPWSACIGEVQTRTRGPIEDAKLKKCGHIECVQTRSCTVSLTTRSTQWGIWSTWSECSLQGRRVPIRTRTRQCRDQSVGSDRTVNSKPNTPSTSNCPGVAYEAGVCENQDRSESSNWMNWSQWSTCERGNQVRTRYCRSPGRCIGAENDTRICSSSSSNVNDKNSRQWNPCTGPRPFNRNCGGVYSNSDSIRRG